MTDPSPESALAECPFCGRDESLYVEHVEGTILHPSYYVRCDYCGAVGPSTDKGDHVEIWNRRTHGAHFAALAAKVEILRNINDQLANDVAIADKYAERAEAERDAAVRDQRRFHRLLADMQARDHRATPETVISAIDAAMGKGEWK